ncbi:MAG: hypothetical protein M1837_005330 [Sclerophora amabilis]|nr:MAG: hypothetical protein M1837_005330 [Sclerophora amabilis]
MKKFIGTLSRRTAGQDDSADLNIDTPEGNASRGIRLFCESGAPNSSGEEVLHLPVIVEAAESSPSAAKEAAIQIRKYLSKENNARAHVQYNALMLVRILADNPGRTFTRNLDGKFVVAVKDLLRTSRDPSVHQILRETLDSFENERREDEGISALLKMWAKEKEIMNKVVVTGGARDSLSRPPHTVPFQPQQQNYFARHHKDRGLPNPAELAQRIEEAKTSAKLLLQVVQSTPPTQILDNELIAEFAERCQSASRSTQGYMNAQNPAPDEDTLLTLIETNDQLALAMSKHQRALLQARKALTSQHTSPPPIASPTAEERHRAEANPFSDKYQTPSHDPSPPSPDGQLLPNTDESSRRSTKAIPGNSHLNDFGHSQGSFHPGFTSASSDVRQNEPTTRNANRYGGEDAIGGDRGDSSESDRLEMHQAASPVSPVESRQPTNYNF